MMVEYLKNNTTTTTQHHFQLNTIQSTQSLKTTSITYITTIKSNEQIPFRSSSPTSTTTPPTSTVIDPLGGATDTTHPATQCRVTHLVSTVVSAFYGHFIVYCMYHHRNLISEDRVHGYRRPIIKKKLKRSSFTSRKCIYEAIETLTILFLDKILVKKMKNI